MDNKLAKRQGLIIIFAFYVLAYALAGLSVFFLREIIVSTEWRIFVFTIIATLVIWIGSLITKNTSIYDAYWSLTPMVFIIYLLVLNWDTLNVYHFLLAAAFLAWSIRLTINWIKTFKNIKVEDWRYARYRAEQSPFLFHIINFFGLQMMPTLIVYTAFLPLISFFALEATAWSLFGSAIILGGFLLQLFADNQMHTFLKNSDGKTVCEVGLWNYSRHPNYLGEIMIWLGSYLALLVSDPSRWYLGLGLILMILLFEFISIPMMENRQVKKRPGYQRYQKTTSRLLPLPKRKLKEEAVPSSNEV